MRSDINLQSIADFFKRVNESIKTTSAKQIKIRGTIPSSYTESTLGARQLTVATILSLEHFSKFNL